jgi:hypothetical protein
MSRSYYSQSIENFLNQDNLSILGELVKKHQFRLEEQQRNSWIRQIEILKDTFSTYGSGYIMFEYSIPRMGKRVDNVFIYNGVVFLFEFKVGEHEYTRNALDQVLDYALDLKNFHQKSRDIPIVPILIATEAKEVCGLIQPYWDCVYKPMMANKNNISQIIQRITFTITSKPIDPTEWENSLYRPTPTIIEAAQALYRGHSVQEISRSDSGAINLSKTTEAINRIIDMSKEKKCKSICFITGVPGAGKTLAGLNIANERHKFKEEEHAVFLSGNGPLVQVLQEALARNEVKNSAGTITKKQALQNAKAFIQNIHHFRDDALNIDRPPIEKVVVFDEAQRAWTLEQTSEFMRRKKGVSDFYMSEPEFLISIMDRHLDWAVIVCLVGGGQEINTGEAGLTEWFSALRKSYRHWYVYSSGKLSDIEYTRGCSVQELVRGLKYTSLDELHLNTSIRSFRSENVSRLVKEILDGNKDRAKKIYKELKEKYPITLTRDLYAAKKWLKEKARGTERIGITASSGAHRLKPFGICVQIKVDAKNWFLNSKDDVRSSYYLEDIATEFDIQGLELDWTCVAWDADLRFDKNKWTYNRFRGTNWQNIRSEDGILYLKNAYRVLLTRARQGMVIFVPHGDESDLTRKCSFYDGTYNYLKEIGFDCI